MMDVERSTPQERIAALESALDQLRRDSQHQMRNMLATIRSIARQTGMATTDHEAVFLRLDGRIAAFGRVQSVILRDPRRGIELGALIADELMAHGIRIDALTIPEQPEFVQPRAAVLIVLVVHELATISETGRGVEVSWNRDAADKLHLSWRSAPAQVEDPLDTAFLMEVLNQAIPYELSGSGRIRMSGQIECEVELPIGCLAS